MEEPILNTEILLSKYVSGNATELERQQIEAWISKSPQNRKLYEKTRHTWEKSKTRLSKSEIQSDQLRIQQEINHYLGQKLNYLHNRNMWLRYAAVLIIPISLAFGWYFFVFENDVNEINQFCEITSPKGNISQVILPDGTEVWLNTNSTICYNTGISFDSNRQVELAGEAYFSVAKHEDSPFVVKTCLGVVNVTGTEFNVKCYPETTTFEAVLTEGKVDLCFDTNQSQHIKLEPGERAVFSADTKSLKIIKTDVELYSTWRNGQIFFKDATLNNLISELERIYDIKFYLKDAKLGEYRFRGMFSYKNNLIDALEKIKKTAKLDYYIENKKVTLTKQ